jgi:hypothetical protein
LDPQAHYIIGTSDFQAFVSAEYRELFAAASEPVETGLDFHQVLLRSIREGPVAAALDGRAGEPLER